MGKKKKQREKITYVDDGSTVYDMSAVGGGRKKTDSQGQKRRSTIKEQFGTYKQSVRMMFFPMLVTLGGITAIFLIIYLILTIAEMRL